MFGGGKEGESGGRWGGCNVLRTHKTSRARSRNEKKILGVRHQSLIGWIEKKRVIYSTIIPITSGDNLYLIETIDDLTRPRTYVIREKKKTIPMPIIFKLLRQTLST